MSSNAAKNLHSHYVLLNDVCVEDTVLIGGTVMNGEEIEFYQGYVP